MSSRTGYRDRSRSCRASNCLAPVTTPSKVFLSQRISISASGKAWEGVRCPSSGWNSFLIDPRWKDRIPSAIPHGRQPRPRPLVATPYPSRERHRWRSSSASPRDRFSPTLWGSTCATSVPEGKRCGSGPPQPWTMSSPWLSPFPPVAALLPDQVRRRAGENGDDYGQPITVRRVSQHVPHEVIRWRRPAQRLSMLHRLSRR